MGPPPPFSYLVSFLLDSTVGLLLIYLLLKAVAWLVNRFQITPLRSGEYGMFHLPFTLHLDFSVCICVTAGKPFRPHYWLAQCSVYLVVMLVMKLIVGPLVAFKFWKEVGPPPSPLPHTHTYTHSHCIFTIFPSPSSQLPARLMK